jgi:hypothetical protein
MQHVAGVCGLCTLAGIVIWHPLRRREAWSWWALLTAGGFLYGSNWLHRSLVGLTDPPLIPDSAQMIPGGFYALGLVLAWRKVNWKKQH